MSKYDAAILSGPAGSGKTVLLSRLLEENKRFQKVITTTTRHPRNELEVDGIDYNFITMEEFVREKDAGKFLESAPVHQYYYGNRRSDLQRVIDAGKIPVYILDVQGAETMRGKIKTLSIFIDVPGLPLTDELVRRLIKRGEKPESIAERMKSVPFELSKRDSYDFIVLNDDFDRAYAELAGILNRNFG